MLVTGANGEIGRSLLQTLAQDGSFEVATLDLTPLPEAARPLASASYTGNIMDRYLLDQLAAHHEVDMVFHLAALLSTRGERDPELAHQINVEGTLNVLRMAQNQSSRLGRAVRVLFPSSIAVYGLPSLDVKRKAGRVREEEWNVPITMYGCNKLYCEHIGRYLTFHARQLGALAGATRLDFRALRFPGLISADTIPAGGTSDFGPEMIHAAAKGADGAPYKCFVEPEARIPFIAMPDAAVRALMELASADREHSRRARLQHRRLQRERRADRRARAAGLPRCADRLRAGPGAREDRRVVARGRGRRQGARTDRLGLAAGVYVGPGVRRIPRAERARPVREGLSGELERNEGSGDVLGGGRAGSWSWGYGSWREKEAVLRRSCSGFARSRQRWECKEERLGATSQCGIRVRKSDPTRRNAALVVDEGRREECGIPGR